MTRHNMPRMVASVANAIDTTRFDTFALLQLIDCFWTRSGAVMFGADSRAQLVKILVSDTFRRKCRLRKHSVRRKPKSRSQRAHMWEERCRAGGPPAERGGSGSFPIGAADIAPPC